MKKEWTNPEITELEVKFGDQYGFDGNLSENDTGGPS